MMKSMLFFICALWAVCLTAAFAPSPSAVPHRSITFKSARLVPGVKPTYMKQTILRMSDEKPSEEEKPAAPAKGETFYDDQYDSAPKKVGLSDSMRQKLMAEATTGLDSEKKQTNVLLYIIAAVAVLVLLGGQGIFY